ncbi:hypothetical protein JW964_17020 [candidate division KSB1 bacterium]|nr:hypothetical protein [candidate division KSB1 bacterium]
MTAIEQHDDFEDKTLNLWEILEILLEKRWMIIKNCAIVFILAVLITFILPKKYTATATLLPPEKNSSINPLGNFSSDMLPNLGFLNTNTTAELFVQILSSRSVKQAVLNRQYHYDDKVERLMDYFDTKILEEGIEKLTEVTAILASPEGIISVSVELGNPELAAAVANAYTSELDSINQRKSTSRAKSSRIYIENQLEFTKKRLQKADSALANFMQTHKAISLADQTRAAIEEAGALKGKIIVKEVELAMKLRIRRPGHEEIVALQAEIAELKKQYAKMQYGTESFSEEDKSEFYIPMVKVPDVSLQLAELMREVKVQETVFELLNQQYYQAKIQETKDTPTVQVLDEALPPAFRSKPKRALIVILAVGIMFLLGVFQAFFSNYFNKIKSQQTNQEKILFIKTTLKADYEKIKRYLQKKKSIDS